MPVRSETIHRGVLRGASIGPSIRDAACEACGLQPDLPGVKLRIFAFVGDAPAEGLPDIEFELVERRPGWWA